MQYMLMIIEDESAYTAPGAMDAIIAKHMEFGMKNGAAIIGGNGLYPALTATTLRTTNGKHSIHDGPFAESREQLGGYYVVDAADLDAAIAIAKQVPLAGDGAIEIRPVLPGPTA
ncbi:MAG: YciI family protein [Sphingomonas sp.]|nr:YciI family protein [Sphingomonas sp.]